MNKQIVLILMIILYIVLFIIINRRNNIFFNITSPMPGTFVITLHYRGRDKAILEMDLKLDDLLDEGLNSGPPIPFTEQCSESAPAS